MKKKILFISEDGTTRLSQTKDGSIILETERDVYQVPNETETM